MDAQTERLQRLIDKSNRIVFFGGAGVSTESGIPDFRSPDGLYKKKYKYPPEILLSRTFFESRTAEFFEFYREKMLHLEAAPNAAHEKLAEMERAGKLKAVITQNIDGLHQKAGSKNVLELHGSVHRNFCTSCKKAYPPEFILNSTGIPRCDCGGVVKPDVVLYEEGLKDDTLDKAIQTIALADMLIVGGTSLAVYPAAGLVQYYRGGKLVLINRDPTPYDASASLILRDNIGNVFQQIQVKQGEI